MRITVSPGMALNKISVYSEDDEEYSEEASKEIILLKKFTDERAYPTSVYISIFGGLGP